MNPIYMFTKTEGRIARQTYWIGIVIITLVGVPTIVAAAFVAGGTGAAIANLFFLWCGFALSVKRAQDRNLHYLFVAAYFGLLALLTSVQASTKGGISDKMMDPSIAPRILVGIVSVVFIAYVVFLFVQLGCLRGTIGPNKYGPDPLQQAVTPNPQQA
jgi:uncharacterized membrane protein YhaH (DUF805 family)